MWTRLRYWEGSVAGRSSGLALCGEFQVLRSTVSPSDAPPLPSSPLSFLTSSQVEVAVAFYLPLNNQPPPEEVDEDGRGKGT